MRRYQSQLWWIKSVTGQSETIALWQTWLQPLKLPAGLGNRTAYCGRRDPPSACRRSGQRAFQSARIAAYCRAQCGRKLKKIWQELGAPPWLRYTTPPLFMEKR
ncbi:tRNA lysidine(34) synthetase TilS [Shigella flexneri]